MKYPRHTQGEECDGCNERLKDAHPLLQSFFAQLKEVYLDVHCSEAHRDEDAQNKAFEEKKSRLKWPHSKHNSLPSLAIDIFQINNAGAAVFDPVFYANAHKFSKEKGFNIRWGGDWNSDGIKNEKFVDAPHFELKDG